MPIEVVIEDARWETAGMDALAQAAIGALCAHLGIDVEACEGAVLACDDPRIRELNAGFREKDKATNVLSWPAEERANPGNRPTLPQPDFEGAIELGDVAISFDTCAREADEQGKSFDHHVTHLLVHGLLHLLGYDHITDEDAEIMEGTETEILVIMGLPDPY
ncbi:rRNA maturation RNase YbeY [Celeribacter arenosi]|uniref:Endoribonuclease YbeY n=1 Tax=Celeribacter arenosi TaxID=792649 RepID=A0ABP7K6V7_9RHOB